MTRITNIASGPRGFHSPDGEIQLDPGKSWEGEISDGEIASATSSGWFEIDGVRRSHVAPAGNDAAAEVAALNQRAEEAEFKLDLALEELATLRRSAPIVAAAVAALDPLNDDHWTKGGEPKVDAVKAITGGDVSREDIEAASPDGKRPTT